MELQTTNYTLQTPHVGIIMGSDSDLKIMQPAADILQFFSIEYELTVVSAHRTPERMFNYAKTAKERGLKVIIAGAGGAAHLPGMAASLTSLPVIGVPVKSTNSIDGWDSVLSILQMPNGVPVATVALKAKTINQLQNLEKKMMRAERKKHGVVQNKIAKLKQLLFPLNDLQERVENFSSFHAKWGRKFIDQVLKNSPSLEMQFVVLNEDSPV